MEGQSAVEYLITYGWMLIAVTTVLGVLYGYLSQGSCDTRVTQGLGETVYVEDAAITGDNRLTLQISSSTIEPVEVTLVEIDDGSEIFEFNYPFQVDGSEIVKVAEAERSESCTTFEVSIKYNEGPLKGQLAVFDIKANAEIIESIIRHLFVGGGRIPSINIDSTVVPNGTTICLGANCPGTVIDTNKTLERSGGRLEGPLKTNALQFECIGAGCGTETGNLDGNVTFKNNTMDGTLKLHVIKPLERLCMGSKC
jgi:hypothetical protein